MRAVEERQIWDRLLRATSDAVPLGRVLAIDDGSSLSLDQRALVLAGFNGAGKTKALNALENALPDGTLLIRLHELCEKIRSLLGSRSDVDQMEEEVGALPVDQAMFDSVKRVIGREYDNIEWYGLELEPLDDASPDGWRGADLFGHGDDQHLIPHFRVVYGGESYASLEMGLGEFSVHVLFWTLWHNRDVPGLLILLDEPDAYLPPRTKLRCLALILDFALRYQWQVVLTTHSDELISAAAKHDCLRVVSRVGGVSKVFDSREHGGALVGELIGDDPADLILFCEDEQAAALIRAILGSHGQQPVERTVAIWKDGDGFLKSLAQHLPRTDVSPVRFSLVLDGDNRNKVDPYKNPAGWPVIFLPTAQSPEQLMRFGKPDLDALSERLDVAPERLSVILDGIEGGDPHDWITELCERIGSRTRTLDVLANLWVERNPEDAAQFAADLARSLSA